MSRITVEATEYLGWHVPAIPGDHLDYSVAYFNHGNYKYCTIGTSRLNNCETAAECGRCILCGRVFEKNNPQFEAFARFAVEHGYKITRKGYTQYNSPNLTAEAVVVGE